jgi:hypothetical protein
MHTYVVTGHAVKPCAEDTKCEHVDKGGVV